MDSKETEPLKAPEGSFDNPDEVIESKDNLCSKLKKIKILKPEKRKKFFNERYRKEVLKLERSWATDDNDLRSIKICVPPTEIFHCNLEEYETIKRNLPKIRFEKSSIHMWGVYNAFPITRDEPIVEYTGVLIRTSVTEARQNYYEKHGNNGSYIFKLENDLF